MPLVQTKLAIPCAAHALVARPRLTALLERALIAKLTLVAAPAGFGKTMLLADWLQRELAHSPASPAVAWVALDADDNCPVRFWSYVLTALANCLPEIAGAAGAALRAAQQGAVDQVLRLLINGLAACRAPVLLVLDDYHLIDAPCIHDALRLLVEHLPPALHLVLLTRAEPPLPLARLRVSGEVVELRADDLRCTLEETAAFVADVLQAQLSPALLTQVHACSEGWLAGLHLLGRALRPNGDQAGLHHALDGCQSDLIDYVLNEVLEREPAHVREFVLHTSVLDQLHGPLCDAICATSPGHSQQLLEYLERSNLFVVALDAQRRCYRYHPLFAGALRHHLRRVAPAQATALHQRASAWWLAQGQHVVAMQHALAAQAWHQAADIAQALPTHYWQGEQLALLRHWCAALPVAMLRQHPRLCLRYAQALYAADQLEACGFWLQTARDALQVQAVAPDTPNAETQLQQPHQQLLGEIVAHQALVAGVRGDGEAAERLADEALTVLGAPSDATRALLAYAHAQAAQVRGQVAVAARHALTASSLARKADLLGEATRYLSFAAHLTQSYGQLCVAWQLLERAIALGASPGTAPNPATALAYAYQADLLREWNQRDEALALVQQALTLAEQADHRADEAACYAVLSRVQYARGAYAAASAAFERCTTPCEPAEQPGWRTSAWLGHQMRLWIACGTLEPALRWARARKRHGQAVAPFEAACVGLAYARLQLAQHDGHGARAVLEPLLPMARADGRAQHVIELLVLLALAHASCGNEAAALAALATALQQGQQQGYLRCFLDEGEPLAALLQRALAHGIEREYVQHLLAAWPSAQQARTGILATSPAAKQTVVASLPLPHAQPLVEPLSPRELDVLARLGRGASNQAIARDLALSTNTVKRHTSNIFGKLGVTNRTQAVAAARTLGLLHKQRARSEWHLLTAPPLAGAQVVATLLERTTLGA
jgi:LuxR family transcriptional regulator, maltose regulon positive regulatory protein